jgi:ferric-dicitrate binding protein FerR (iron transport regulator)
MSSIDPAAGSEVSHAAMAAAVDWVGRLQTGTTDVEREAFVAWLQSSPAHVRAYLDITSTADALRRLFLQRTAWVKDRLEDLD